MRSCKSSLQFSTVAAAAILLAAASTPPIARGAEVDIDAKARDVAKSLVAVEFTLQNENSSQEGSGQGIVISKDGVILLVSGEMISEAYPHEWIKEIKLRLPSRNFANPVPAKLLGRTRNGLFAFLKASQPIDTPVFEPGDIEPTKLGQAIFSVGLLDKDGGYGTYVGVSRTKAILDLRHVAVRTVSFGLTNGNSPVFDAETGKLVGLTMGGSWDGMMQVGNSLSRIRLRDDEQGFAFYPNEEIAPLFKEIPTEPFTMHRSWLGVDEITGLQENLVALKKLDQTSGVMLGSIIPNEAGDKAGLKSQDIVLTVDGKEFSKTPVPSIMVEHFSRTLEAHKPGDVVTLGILRDGEKQDVKVTLGTFPKTAAEMPYVFSPRIGIVTRDLVFTDAYARRLPQDTKGVIVALVKNGTPASLGSTPLHAQYLITKVDDQPVDNQAQFLTLLKKIEDNPEAKEAVFVVIQPNGENEVCRIDLSK